MSLDDISNGRFELGIGAGWSAEEYAALGVPFERRGRRFDEYIEAMRSAWRDDLATYHGEFISFDDVVLSPKPLTPHGPPLLVGGNSAPAIRRAATLGDGWYGWWTDNDIGEQFATARVELESAGRGDDPDFRVKVGVPFDGALDTFQSRLDQARTLGVDELVLGVPVRQASLEADLER